MGKIPASTYDFRCSRVRPRMKKEVWETRCGENYKVASLSMKDCETIISAALRQSQGVPREVVDKLTHWRNHSEELMRGADNPSARNFHEGAYIAYQNAINSITHPNPTPSVEALSLLNAQEV